MTSPKNDKYKDNDEDKSIKSTLSKSSLGDLWPLRHLTFDQSDKKTWSDKIIQWQKQWQKMSLSLKTKPLQSSVKAIVARCNIELSWLRLLSPLQRIPPYRLIKPLFSACRLLQPFLEALKVQKSALHLALLYELYPNISWTIMSETSDKLCVLVIFAITWMFEEEKKCFSSWWVVALLRAIIGDPHLTCHCYRDTCTSKFLNYTISEKKSKIQTSKKSNRHKIKETKRQN